jgi:hypothetical protein
MGSRHTRWAHGKTKAHGVLPGGPTQRSARQSRDTRGTVSSVNWAEHTAKQMRTANCPVGRMNAAHSKTVALGKLLFGPIAWLWHCPGVVSCFTLLCSCLLLTAEPLSWVSADAHNIESLPWRSLPCDFCCALAHGEDVAVRFFGLSCVWHTAETSSLVVSKFSLDSAWPSNLLL